MRPNGVHGDFYEKQHKDRFFRRDHKEGPPNRRLLGLIIAAVIILGVFIGIPYLRERLAPEKQGLVITASPLVVRTATIAPNEELVAEDLITDLEVVLGERSLVLNYLPGYPFIFSYPEQSIELTINNGKFLLWDIDMAKVEDCLTTGGYDSESAQVEAVGNTHRINGEGCVFWLPVPGAGYGGLLPDAAVIEYRVYEDSHIAGYGIIEISLKDVESESYAAKLLLAAEFPQVATKYQDVTEKDLVELKKQALASSD